VSRAYSRRPNGRFGRLTMREAFGLDVYVCQDCRRMNPVTAGEKPERCHACGSENLS